jgi:SNF family Na+-dependent transporter
MKFSGGVFFIPFFIFFILIAIPLFTLENALGQIFKKGPVEVFDMMHKKFRGVGWAAVLVCWFISIYYAIILCWSVYYMILSFISPLPWSMGAQSQMNNVTNTNTTSVEEDFINFDFFTKEVLRMSDGIHNMGSLNYELAGCLVITYFLIFICIYEGIKSSSKAVYFTCPAPVILMIILLLKYLLI